MVAHAAQGRFIYVTRFGKKAIQSALHKNINTTLNKNKISKQDSGEFELEFVMRKKNE